MLHNDSECRKWTVRPHQSATQEFPINTFSITLTEWLSIGKTVDASSSIRGTGVLAPVGGLHGHLPCIEPPKTGDPRPSCVSPDKEARMCTIAPAMRNSRFRPTGRPVRAMPPNHDERQPAPTLRLAVRCTPVGTCYRRYSCCLEFLSCSPWLSVKPCLKRTRFPTCPNKPGGAGISPVQKRLRHHHDPVQVR